MAVDNETILEALKAVYDPEIPIDIVNLGLIYEVKVDGSRVDIKMTTTAPGCPMGNYIAGQAERVLRNLEGVGEVHVAMVFDPPWSPDRVSEEGKRALGLG
jgi:metal-sulfur cluster biosynthetic enzyme